MTEKQKYIGAFLDGYFSDKKVDYGMQYYSMLNNAIDVAEKKWKKYKKQLKMKKVIKSVIRLSEIPEKLQKNEIFNGHKIHTYAEFHIDNSEKDELSNWLISNYPTIKRKTSFLIHIDKEVNKDYSETIKFVYWLMENCELIKDDETEENTLWRFDSEDYSVEGLHEHYINNVI